MQRDMSPKHDVLLWFWRSLLAVVVEVDSVVDIDASFDIRIMGKNEEHVNTSCLVALKWFFKKKHSWRLYFHSFKEKFHAVFIFYLCLHECI